MFSAKAASTRYILIFGSVDKRAAWRETNEGDKLQKRQKKKEFLDSCTRYTVLLPGHFGFIDSKLLSLSTLIDLKEGRCVVLNSMVHYLDRTCGGYKEFMEKLEGNKIATEAPAAAQEGTDP